MRFASVPLAFGVALIASCEGTVPAPPSASAVAATAAATSAAPTSFTPMPTTPAPATPSIVTSTPVAAASSSGPTARPPASASSTGPTPRPLPSRALVAGLGDDRRVALQGCEPSACDLAGATAGRGGVVAVTHRDGPTPTYELTVVDLG